MTRTGSYSSLTRQLVAILRRPISASERERAALHVLDWLGCAAAGARSEVGRKFVSYSRTLAPGKAAAIGGTRLPARDAALVNGAVGNVLEMDDFYRTALVHPGPVIVPLALAVAEELDFEGPAALDAIVRGFEAMIRIGRSVGPTHYRYFHNTATAGIFGAAVTAGVMLDLDDDQFVHALGNAGTQASGLWQCRIEDTMSKQLHNGRAAQAGLMTATLARHGLTGAAQILEGPLGFYQAMCRDAEPDRLLIEGDGPWLIHGCSFKPWPACRHCHPTIDAALELHAQVSGQDVKSVRVRSYRDAIAVCDNVEPATDVQAKFSLQHAAAVILLRGRPGLADFAMDSVRAPDVSALRRCVSIAEDPRFTVAYPGRFGAAIELELADGRKLAADMVDAFGDPENPMSKADVRSKAEMLFQAAEFPEAASARLVRHALELPSGLPVATLMRDFN